MDTYSGNSFVVGGLDSDWLLILRVVAAFVFLFLTLLVVYFDLSLFLSFLLIF